MTTATVDIAPLHDWFAELAAAQSDVDREFDESVAALEAYQSHLDHCQAALAAERASLEEERATLEAERQRLNETPVSEEAQLAELGEARKLISELRDLLLERTEELRRSDNKRSELVSELQQARSRQLELEKHVEVEKSQHLEQQLRWTEEFQRVSELLENRTGSKTESGKESTADPVLGSIMAQFGKLRRQAADRRAGRAGK